jgi:hypothetical protein
MAVDPDHALRSLARHADEQPESGGRAIRSRRRTEPEKLLRTAALAGFGVARPREVLHHIVALAREQIGCKPPPAALV